MIFGFRWTRGSWRCICTLSLIFCSRGWLFKGCRLASFRGLIFRSIWGSGRKWWVVCFRRHFSWGVLCCLCGRVLRCRGLGFRWGVSCPSRRSWGSSCCPIYRFWVWRSCICFWWVVFLSWFWGFPTWSLFFFSPGWSRRKRALWVSGLSEILDSWPGWCVSGWLWWERGCFGLSWVCIGYPLPWASWK